jgi:hypothetical protein
MSKWKFAVSWCLSTSFGLIQLYKYNAEWDKELNLLLDLSWRIASTRFCTIQFGEREVWTANAFYAYGVSRDLGNKSYDRARQGIYRPSIKTMWRLESLRRYLVEKESADKVIDRLKGTDVTYEDFFV